MKKGCYILYHFRSLQLCWCNYEGPTPTCPSNKTHAIYIIHDLMYELRLKTTSNCKMRLCYRGCMPTVPCFLLYEYLTEASTKHVILQRWHQKIALQKNFALSLLVKGVFVCVIYVKMYLHYTCKGVLLIRISFYFCIFILQGSIYAVSHGDFIETET